MKKVILPICCFCLVALLGIGLWQGNFFDNKKLIAPEDSTVIGDKDYVEPDTNSEATNVDDDREFIATIKYNGANYVQCSTSTKAYTPNEYLGEAFDFEGCFHLKEGVSGVYNVKEDPNVLMVEIKNGEYTDIAFFIKEQAE